MKLFIPLILLSILTISGCGGFRSGFASVPYIGDVEPIAEEKFFEFYDYSLILPGMKLDVAINNRIRTRDIAVMLFVVPIAIDVIDRPYYTNTDRFQISLSIIPKEQGFTFNPMEVKVTVDGQSFKPALTEFRGGPYKSDLRSVIEKEISLTKDTFHAIDMTFDRPVPTTDRTITLNIGNALMHPHHPAIPTIRFKQVRWKQGYS